MESAVVSNNNSATHNVAEKLEKKDAVFLTAFLGSLANKQKFLDTQTGVYPDMHDWEMPLEKRRQLELETTATVFPLLTTLAIIFKIVWVFPVPGGPWIMLIFEESARSTASF